MRFYVSPESIDLDKNIIRINQKDKIHHIRDVMRLKKGVGVDVFDGKGMEYRGNIEDIDRGSIVIAIKGRIQREVDLRYRVILYQAIPKKRNMDSIVEKAVQLGVDRIVPMITERTIVDTDSEKGRSKIERWARITKEASEQCGRVKLAEIEDIVDFSRALDEAKKSELVIFAALCKDSIPLKKFLPSSKPKDISIFVGPEGDFSAREISLAREAGFSIISLGQLVLKVETAGICILSCLNYEYSH